MSYPTSLARLDAIGQAELTARGGVSVAELLAACFERIERYDPLLRAVVDVARAQPASLAPGPLHGVPFLVKDVMPWPELRWSMGSRLFARNVTRRETPLGKRMSRAGLCCVGKSAMS